MGADGALSAIPMSAIEQNSVVAMHYVLTDESGTVIDESPKGEPLYYLHGHQNIVPGLEKELSGLKQGDKKKVVVSPEEGYGVREDEMTLTVPRSELPDDLTPEVGMTLGMESQDGHTMPVTVTEVFDDRVVLDANHELAGVTLHFDVTIDSVRPATAEELSHGHVHGPGGHHH